MSGWASESLSSRHSITHLILQFIAQSKMKRQRPENGHSKSPSKRGRQQQQLQSMVGEWSELDHRDLVAAIFEIGLKHSSPSALLEFMAENEDLTVERIKSRLQKFRLKREESKAEFLSSYDETMARYKSDEAVSGLVPTYDGVRNQAAEAAAFLTHATIAEGSGRPLPFNPEPHITGAGANGVASSVAALSQSLPFGQNNPVKSLPLSVPSASLAVGAVHVGGDGGGDATDMNEPGEVGGAPLRLPDLTEEERNAPIGQSFDHLMGLFASLKDNLLKQRAEEDAVAAATSNGGTKVQNNGGTDELAFAAPPAAAAASTAAHVTSGASGLGELVGDGDNANVHQYLPYPSRPGAPDAAAGSSSAWGQDN